MPNTAATRSRKQQQQAPVQRIPRSELLDIVRELGLRAKAMAGFVKVAGTKGHAVYLAKTNKVTRVELYGFTLDGVGVVDLGEKAHGKVEQAIDFTRSPAQVKLTLKRALQKIMTLPPEEQEAA